MARFGQEASVAGREPPSGPSGGPPLMRRINQGRVLATVRAAGPLRLGELAERAGLSRPTVSHVLDELREAGWVAYLDEHPAGRSGLGRPARLVRFRSEAGYALGIDIGPHQTSVMVADVDGQPAALTREATSAAHDQRQLLAAVRAAVRDCLGRAGVARRDVLSVAVGSPGIIDRRTGTVTQAPGLPGWTSLNLTGALRRSFHCPVAVDNDVNLAVLGERWRGVARDARTVVFVLWGERVGAGICIDGRLHRGAAGAAGEIGYLTVLTGESIDARPDEHGRGPFERAVGAGAITREVAARQRGASRAHADVPAVFTAAEGGDPVARRAIEAVAGRLAHGLAPLLLVLDPDMLVIGGGVSQAGPKVLEAVQERLRPLTLAPTPVRLSALGEDAVVIGAVRLALTDIERRLFPSADPH